MSKIPNLKDLVFRDTPFAELMNRRIYNVLLIATRYDSFMLEDDGRVDEQIFNEYTALSLSYPPRFTQVTTSEEALRELESRNFELIICMPNMYDRDAFATAKEMKERYSDIPVVVLTPFSKEVGKRVNVEDLSSINYVFSWLGNAELLIAIIKLIEDEMNIPNDIEQVGVQTILVVEDSIRFYSSVLTYLYKFVLEQSQEFSKEALNHHQQTLRMRGRPKIKLARTYEEAKDFYDKYSENILGVISDVSFMKDGKKDKQAGIAFAQYIRKTSINIPIIIDSSNEQNQIKAEKLDAAFIDKNSKTFSKDLRRHINQRFGFGNFIIVDPESGEEIMEIKDLKDLQKKIFNIPDAPLAYHLTRDHFSRFFYSRALFPPAAILKHVDVSDYKNMDEARNFIFKLIVEYRRSRNEGVVAIYMKERFDEYSNFARIGEGSLGGKGRGLAFMGTMIKRYPKLIHKNLYVNIPKTIVVCTDIFDDFMSYNNLYDIALKEVEDEIIFKKFQEAIIPDHIKDDLRSLFNTLQGPIAIRSSSLLEDSHYQPFAGVYSTYMIPNLSDKEVNLQLLLNAIKAVYASVFYKDSKTYLRATSNLIDQEKMAIVIQEVIGSTHEEYFYPTVSGVARSLNFYPINDEQVKDGIANIALGLGKYIVDGFTTLRFSPKHPKKILQMSNLDMALKETQTRFYGLKLKDNGDKISMDDSFNLAKLTLKEADKHHVLKEIASTYDHYNLSILDGYYPEGRKILSFVHILQHDSYPMAKTIDYILRIGAKEMGRPVEIEFAMDINSSTKQAFFYLLQIRPIVDNKEEIKENLSEIDRDKVITFAQQALGHGITNDVYDFVYVKEESFNSSNNQEIAYEINKLNQKFIEENRNYVLMGPGRWGSSDPWLGIPVKWAHISNARCIIECGLPQYQVDPSQGTHFFQNLTSLGVGYFTIQPFKNDGFLDNDYLNAQESVFETKYLRHIRFNNEITIKIDGLHNNGVILKPEN